MPCSKYKSKKQRGLCYLTGGWKDWSKVKGKKKHKHPIIAMGHKAVKVLGG